MPTHKIRMAQMTPSVLKIKSKVWELHMISSPEKNIKYYFNDVYYHRRIVGVSDPRIAMVSLSLNLRHKQKI